MVIQNRVFWYRSELHEPSYEMILAAGSEEQLRVSWPAIAICLIYREYLNK